MDLVEVVIVGFILGLTIGYAKMKTKNFIENQTDKICKEVNKNDSD